jgi:putative phosphoribosyl transferase
MPSSWRAARRRARGYEVAQALGLPLDVLVVRKLGLPSHPELAMGAIASGGAVVRNEEVLRYLGGRADAFEQVKRREQAELDVVKGIAASAPSKWRVRAIWWMTVSPGATMERQCALRANAKRVIVAVPVASGGRAINRGSRRRVVCLETPIFSAPSASGTAISGRRPTMRSANCWLSRSATDACYARPLIAVRTEVGHDRAGTRGHQDRRIQRP